MPKDQRFAACEAGATAVEYALIAMSVALAVVASLEVLGANLSAYYGQIAAAFP